MSYVYQFIFANMYEGLYYKPLSDLEANAFQRGEGQRYEV